MGPAPHPSPLPSHPWPQAEVSFVIPPPNPSFQTCSHHRLLGAPVLQHPAPHPAPKASSQGPGGWVHRLAKQTYPRAPESRLDLPRRGVAVSSSCSAWPVQPHAGTQTQSQGRLEQLLPKGRDCISSLGLHRPPVTGLSQPIPQAQCGSEPPRGTRSFNPRQGPYSPLCTDGCVRHQEVTYALQGGRKFIPNPCVWPPLSCHPGPLVNPQRPSLACYLHIRDSVCHEPWPCAGPHAGPRVSGLVSWVPFLCWLPWRMWGPWPPPQKRLSRPWQLPPRE